MLEKILALPVDAKTGDTVTRPRLGDVDLLVVDHPRARGAVALQGGQLLAWQPSGHEPVLWSSERALWTAGTAIRGGVPLCWPWFGEAGVPKHGFARLCVWEPVDCRESAEGVELLLALESTPATLAQWPHAFRLETRIRLGTEAGVELRVRAEAPTTAALHTYLAVGGVGAVGVTGLGETYTDGLREHAPGRQAGPIIVPEGAPHERYFTCPEPTAEVRDAGLGRVVALHHPEASDVVVWNPGAEQTLADVAPGAWRDFLCVESARLDSPLEPGTSGGARLGVTFSVRR